MTATTSQIVSGITGLTDSQAAAVTRSIGHKRTEAVVKHIGTSSGSGMAYNQTTSLSASDITTTVKIETEADFYSVKLALINRAQNAITGNTAVVGVTETNAIDTSALMGSPTIGGTSYQALAGAGTVTGWRSVTWAGAASVDVAAASAGQTFAISDSIALSSIARTDGGTRPLLMWRTWRGGAAAGNWSFNTHGTASRTASTPMRNRTFVASNAFSNAVTTLNTAMSLTTTVQPVFPIVRFTVPVVSVWGVGDSIMQDAAQAEEGLSAWGYRACMDVSTPTAPVVWANMGASSQTAAVAWAAAKALLTAGAPAPTVLVVQPASVNDDASPDVRTREAQLATAMDVLATAKQYGIPYVVWAPLMPYNTLNSAQDTIRKGTNTLMQSLAASNGVFWLDFSNLGDGADPEKWITAYNDGTGAAGDGIHADTDAFEDVMAPALVSVLRQLV